MNYEISNNCSISIITITLFLSSLIQTGDNNSGDVVYFNVAYINKDICNKEIKFVTVAESLTIRMYGLSPKHV